MEWLFIAAGVVVVAFAVHWLITRKGPSVHWIGRAEDECPLDRLNARRRAASPGKDGPAAESAPPPEDPTPEALRPAVRKLASMMPQVVAEGAKELGESGHAEAAVPLLRALSARQRSVRFAVVEALVRLGPLAAAPLEAALERETDLEQRALLGRIRDQFERQAKGRELAPTDDVVGASSRLVDEMAEGWSGN